ncbi:MAG: hypothetical protein AAGA10_15260 [Bacteroidota bacterium]
MTYKGTFFALRWDKDDGALFDKSSNWLTSSNKQLALLTRSRSIFPFVWKYESYFVMYKEYTYAIYTYDYMLTSPEEFQIN